jgi:ribulose-phosphate 3-epimerase
MTQQSTLVAPSLLAADFARLAEEVAAIETAGADWLHLDVMDGHFVPNISFGPVVVKALRKHTRMPFDVHLMIAPVDLFITAFAEAGANHILFHPEAGPHPHRTLQAIRAAGCKSGLVLNPGSPIALIEPMLDLTDIILLMSVNPGFGGQKFIESSLPRISQLRELIDASGHDIRLEVDGGVDAKTAPRCISAGADTLVAGTAVFGTTDYRAAIEAIRRGPA